MQLADLKQRLVIPVIASPMFIVSSPELVIAQCTSGIVGAFPALNARPEDQLVGLFDALGSACRRDGYRGCAFLNAAAESMPGTVVHERTVAHKAAVLEWVAGLAADAGALDPRGLARSLTLLLDGGLASGALDADPDASARAAESARVLVDAALARPVGG